MNSINILKLESHGIAHNQGMKNLTNTDVDALYAGYTNGHRWIMGLLLSYNP
ncbi:MULTISPECIES: hypothetical protein [Fischerella]|uniref:hypothetical protein n=1 Tax=Fischerella TaxID=1190 RepID=UPI000A9B1C34|nr:MULTISPECIES: hypothetical protein [Fischerella]